MNRATSRRPESVKAHRGIWAVIAVVAAVSVTIGAVVSATEVAHAANQRSQAALVTSAGDIGDSINLSLEHEQDLVVAAVAYFSTNPMATQAQFLQWMNTVSAFKRYPELVGMAQIAVVAPAGLAVYAANNASSPAAAATLTVTPSGNRAFYCLRADYAARSGTPIPAGYDLCQSSEGPYLLAIRDSGTSADLPYGSGKSEGLGLASPIYLGGTVPATVAARRAAGVGWVGEQIDPYIILRTARAGHAQTAVAIQYGKGATAVRFTSGMAPVGAHTVTVSLHDGWTVRVAAPVFGAGIMGNGSARVRLLLGILVGLLLGALIYVLGTSRSRAVKMVNERTEQLRQLALHDPLTGLPNRTLILDRLDQMMARARREGTQVAALFLDLDNFKDINDSFGHQGGDALLNEVASRLVDAVRDGDSVGRLGGDEFVVVADGASMAGSVSTVADRILAALSHPFVIEGSDYAVSVTVSIGMAEGLRSEPEQLLLDADVALYSAKAEGKRRAVLFSPTMQAAMADRRHLERDLHQALAAGQFFAEFPTTLALSPGAPVGVEARLGWRHPDRGVVDPDQFYPLLESTELIVPVGQWLLELACRYGAGLDGDDPSTVSVPVSAVQFRQEHFVSLVRDTLATSGCDPTRLIVVLAEPALKRGDGTSMGRLRELKALGVRIGLGEFDSGYSTFTYLRNFPIDVLQIDRSLANDSSDPVEVAAVIETLGHIGKAFGVAIVAERPVETAETSPGPVAAGAR